jgi:hypothetical protein
MHTFKCITHMSPDTLPTGAVQMGSMLGAGFPTAGLAKAYAKRMFNAQPTSESWHIVSEAGRFFVYVASEAR